MIIINYIHDNGQKTYWCQPGGNCGISTENSMSRLPFDANLVPKRTRVLYVRNKLSPSNTLALIAPSSTKM